MDSIKKTNKGFTLIELVVVIAIMMILASAITLAVIHNIEKSKKSDCINTRKTMENDYMVEKVSIEEQRNNMEGCTDLEYDLQEFLDAHEGEYRCKSHGSFRVDEDGTIGCTKHGSIYTSE